MIEARRRRAMAIVLRRRRAVPVIARVMPRLIIAGTGLAAVVTTVVVCAGWRPAVVTASAAIAVSTVTIVYRARSRRGRFVVVRTSRRGSKRAGSRAL